MPRRPRLRQCKRCGQVHPGREKECARCGAPLVQKRWRMTKARIKYVHVLAMRQKGLTREEYELRLQAAGVDSCKDLKRRQWDELLRGLKRLPDVRA